MLDTMNDRRIGREQVIEKFGVPPGEGRRRAGADGRQRRQRPRRARHRPEDRDPADPAIWRPRGGARAAPTRSPSPSCKQNLIEHADNGAAVARAGAADLRRAACPSRSRRWRSRASPRSRCAIPRGSRLQDPARPAARRRRAHPAERGRLTSWRRSRRPPRRRKPKTSGRPLGLRDGDRRGGARPLDRRGDGAGPGRDRHRDRRHRLRHRPAGRDQPRHRAQQGLLHPARPWRRRPLFRAPDQLPTDVVLARLKPLLEDPAVLKIGHNLKFDWVMFDQHGIDVAPYDDTMVMSFDLDAGRNGHGMDDLAKKHLDHECITFKELCGTGAEADHLRPGAARPGDRICRRGRRRRAAAVEAAEAAAGGRERRPASTRWSTGRWSRWSGGWSGAGSRSTATIWRKLSSEFSKEIAALEARICEAAGGPFTIGSPQQLGEVLFDQLGLKGGRKGKSGTYSTDVTELERLAAEGVDRAAGARLAPADQAASRPIPTRCRRRSTRRPGGSTPASACRARRPGGCPRPTPICRTSRSAPRSAARSATPSSPSPAIS